LLKKEIVRKSVHLLTAGIILVNIFSYELAITLTIFTILLYIFSEFMRLKKIKIFYLTKLIETCARPDEKNKFILAPLTLAVPILLALLFLNPGIAYPTVITVSISDSFATLIGMRFGKKRIFEKKTLEGSSTFFLFTFVIFYFFTNIFVTFFSAAILTLVELFSKKIDNLTIPLFSAIILSLV